VGLLTIRRAAALVGVAALIVGCRGASAPAAAPSLLRPALVTAPAGEDADDPAIWVNRAHPERSLVLGANKAAAPAGALVVYDLSGAVRQRIDGLDRPNNVDVEYGFRLGGTRIDVAVLTERYQRRLRAYRIEPDGTLVDASSLGGLRVFDGEPGERGAPMGIALYRRPSDGSVFAFVSRKESPPVGTVWQYRLEDDGGGRVRAIKVRELGEIVPGNEVEAVAVDDAHGAVYYAEEPRAIHQWCADPADPRAAIETALFGREGFAGDREGLAVYGRPDGRGFLLAADQLAGGSRIVAFRRTSPAEANRDLSIVRTVATAAVSTDGLDATAEPLGPRFPNGLVVAMNDRGHNFFLYRPQDLGLVPGRSSAGVGQ
jgi:3-phytase